MNFIKEKRNIKNVSKQEMDIPLNLDALNKWDEIPMPSQWKLAKTGYIPAKNEHNIDHIEQTPEGIVYIQMESTSSKLGHIPRTYSTRSERSYISPLLDNNDYTPYRVSTSQVSTSQENNRVDQVLKTKENIVKGIYNTDPEITESEMHFSL